MFENVIAVAGIDLKVLTIALTKSFLSLMLDLAIASRIMYSLTY